MSGRAAEGAPARDKVIEVRGLRNQFGTQVVHDNLDLDIFRGEIVGVVGGSGSGKSVLLRSIIGLNRPAAGSVKVLGTDMMNASDEQRVAVERRCGVLFQNGALFSSLSVADNVMVPMREHHDLPLTLTVGDEVLIDNTGAYTTTYSTVAFNGFPPLQTYII